MTVKVNNVKPSGLTPYTDDNVTGDMSLIDLAKPAVIDNLLQPLVASAPASIEVDSNVLDEYDIMELMIRCSDDVRDNEAEDIMSDILRSCLVDYKKSHSSSFDTAYLNQAAMRSKMPLPSSVVIYTPDDITDASRNYIAGRCDESMLLASIGYYAMPETLGVAFANDVAFDEFKQWMSAQVAAVASTCTPETNQMFADFDSTVHLNGLTESLILRKSQADSCEPMSFARMLVRFCQDYARLKRAPTCVMLPFSVSQLLVPETIVFVNVAAHSCASKSAIANEWSDINTSINMPVRALPLNRISKLNSVAAAKRSAKQASAAAARARNRAQNDSAKRGRIRFGSKSPSTPQLLRRVKRIMKRMSDVNRSQNSFKVVKSTFARPSRRDPDDFNRQGRMASTRYKPDIHIYLDTSGSIDEENYADMVRACIALARKLNVSLYVNSFSHIMSEATLLHTKGRTSKQIYQQFRKIPKVTGGTDYEQIWSYITDDRKRRRELSIIITDFEYSPPRRFNPSDYPKNLFYVPCSNMDWDDMCYWAQNFVNSMQHISPKIRTHVLM